MSGQGVYSQAPPPILQLQEAAFYASRTLKPVIWPVMLQAIPTYRPQSTLRLWLPPTLPGVLVANANMAPKGARCLKGGRRVRHTRLRKSVSACQQRGVGMGAQCLQTRYMQAL